MSLNFTTIHHDLRKKLGISCNAYCVADMVNRLSQNRTGKHPGWCNMSRGTMAERLGITRQSIITIVQQLEKAKLIERDPETEHLRSGNLWIETICTGKETLHPTTETDDSSRKETLHGVKKLDIGCKESLHDGCKESLPDINTLENNTDNVCLSTDAQTQIDDDNETVDAAQGPPPPPVAATFFHNTGKVLESMLTFVLWKENVKHTVSTTVGVTPKKDGSVDFVFRQNDAPSDLPSTVKGLLMNMGRMWLTNTFGQLANKKELTSKPFEQLDAVNLLPKEVRALAEERYDVLPCSISLLINQNTMLDGSVRFAPHAATNQLFLTSTVSQQVRTVESMWQEICASSAPTATSAEPTTSLTGSNAPAKKRKRYGDGVLYKMVGDFWRENPDKYDPEMYDEFLDNWTSVVQKDDKNPENVGQELWRTHLVFPVAKRLEKWSVGYDRDKARKLNESTSNNKNAGSGSNNRAKGGYKKPFKRTPAITPDILTRGRTPNRDANNDSDATTIVINVD